MEIQRFSKPITSFSLALALRLHTKYAELLNNFFADYGSVRIKVFISCDVCCYRGYGGVREWRRTQHSSIVTRVSRFQSRSLQKYLRRPSIFYRLSEASNLSSYLNKKIADKCPKFSIF